MNAVVLADGWSKGGRDGARRALEAFWSEVGALMPAGMVTQGEGDALSLTPASKMLASWAALFSPSQLNPMGLNPLRDLLTGLVDFEQMRADSPFKLFVGTTQANTGKLRVFRETELTVDVLLASACLPRFTTQSRSTASHTGMAGTRATRPCSLFSTTAPDVLLVLLSPLVRGTTPRTLAEIEERIEELSFSATFMREMQTFARAAEFSSPTFVARGRLERKLQTVRFHIIEGGHFTSLQRGETKLLAHGPFLELLHEQGLGCAMGWLATHSESIGQRSTVDIQQWFT